MNFFGGIFGSKPKEADNVDVGSKGIDDKNVKGKDKPVSTVVLSKGSASKTQKKNAKYASKIRELDQKVDKLNSSISSIDSQIADSKKKINAYDGQLDGLDESIEELKAMMAELARMENQDDNKTPPQNGVRA